MEYQRRDMKVLELERDIFHFIPSDRHVHVRTDTLFFLLPGALRVSFRKEKVDKRVEA